MLVFFYYFVQKWWHVQFWDTSPLGNTCQKVNNIPRCAITVHWTVSCLFASELFKSPSQSLVCTPKGPNNTKAKNGCVVSKHPGIYIYLFTTVPHPHGHWQIQELLGNMKDVYTTSMFVFTHSFANSPWHLCRLIIMECCAVLTPTTVTTTTTVTAAALFTTDAGSRDVIFANASVRTPPKMFISMLHNTWVLFCHHGVLWCTHSNNTFAPVLLF